jgi:hypothetical protein
MQAQAGAAVKTDNKKEKELPANADNRQHAV